jgi:UDP-N-acetylmuramyl tripeptide synthase
VGSRTAARLARTAGFSGTSLPGLVAERVSPGVGRRLATDLGPVTLVSGTNGKTTTARILATILRRTGRAVVANASGANLGQAVTSALVARAELTGTGLRRPGGYGVFEVDEAVLPGLVGEIDGAQLLLTNIFRDQLDRFGETDRIIRLWRPVLDGLPGGVSVIFCADDPRLADLVAGVPLALGYGFAGPPSIPSGGDVTADVSTCPVCGGELATDWTSIGHLGSYRCPACGFRRPRPWLSVRVVESAGFAGQTLGFRWTDETLTPDEDPADEAAGADLAAAVADEAAGADLAAGAAAAAPGDGLSRGAGPVGSSPELTVRVRLIGTANAYNAAAAVAAAVNVGVARTEAVAALEGVGGPFGRWETLEIDGRLVVLSLVKNPASLDEVTRAGSSADVDGIVFAFNDAHADGRDVSWYWDVDPTALVPGRTFAIAGTRAPDFLLRLRYQMLDDASAELDGLVGLFDRPVDGLDAIVAAIPPGGTILVVSTYTALLGLRAELVARGHLEAMPT